MKFQADKLEADIRTMRKELEEPTEVEIELKRRLEQLTDHLIQKQSQVYQHFNIERIQTKLIFRFILPG